jgi:hypothetical protein
MMARHIRNHEIAAAYATGETVNELAKRFELQPATIRKVVEDMKPFLREQMEQPIYSGMSLVASVTVQRAIGLWPNATNIEEIACRRLDLLRYGNNSKHVRIAIAEAIAAAASKNK